MMIFIFLFLAGAANADSDFYLHQFTVPVDGTKAAQVSGFRGALFSEFSVADEHQVRREIEAELFARLPAARAWLVPAATLDLEIERHGPVVEREVERLWGPASRKFREIEFHGRATLNLIFPGDAPEGPAVTPENKITGLELIAYADDVRLAAVPLETQALAHGDLALVRNDDDGRRLRLSSDLRYRMHRALAGRRVSVGDFKLTLGLRLGDPTRVLEIPLFDFDEADGVPGFNRTFLMNPTRFTSLAYLRRRCAELLDRIR